MVSSNHTAKQEITKDSGLLYRLLIISYITKYDLMNQEMPRNTMAYIQRHQNIPWVPESHA